jgi:hypothetical protein
MVTAAYPGIEGCTFLSIRPSADSFRIFHGPGADLRRCSRANRKDGTAA